MPFDLILFEGSFFRYGYSGCDGRIMQRSLVENNYCTPLIRRQYHNAVVFFDLFKDCPADIILRNRCTSQNCVYVCPDIGFVTSGDRFRSLKVIHFAFHFCYYILFRNRSGRKKEVESAGQESFSSEESSLLDRSMIQLSWSTTLMLSIVDLLLLDLI